MFKILFYPVVICLLAFGIFAIFARVSELQQASPALASTSSYTATPHPGVGTATPGTNRDQANIDFMAGLLKDMTSSTSDSNNGNRTTQLTAQDHYNLGYALLTKDRNYSEAINEFTLTLGMDPYNVDATYLRGYSYVYGGRPDIGLADYSRALQLKPDYAAVYSSRGDVYRLFMYDYTRAISDYKKAITLAPKYGQAYTGLGLSYYDLYDYDSALIALDKAIQVDPTEALAYNTRGLTHSELDESDLAIKDYTQAIKLYPKYGDAYGNRAWEYEYIGNNSAALADFKKVLEVSTDPDERKYAQEEIRSLQGD